MSNDFRAVSLFFKYSALADRTAPSMIGYLHDTVACMSLWLSVCDAVYCGARSRWKRLKVVHICVLKRYFLFTSSDTFAVWCIVRPQHTASWIAMHGQCGRGHLTTAIPDAEFSAIRFRSSICSTIGLLSDSYASCNIIPQRETNWRSWVTSEIWLFGVLGNLREICWCLKTAIQWWRVRWRATVHGAGTFARRQGCWSA